MRRNAPVHQEGLRVTASVLIAGSIHVVRLRPTSNRNKNRWSRCFVFMVYVNEIWFHRIKRASYWTDEFDVYLFIAFQLTKTKTNKTLWAGRYLLRTMWTTAQHPFRSCSPFFVTDFLRLQKWLNSYDCSASYVC